MSWIPHPTVLKGEHVTLSPLQSSDFEPLFECGKVEEIWKFSPTGTYGFDRDKHNNFLNECLKKRTSGDFYPFVVRSGLNAEVAGFTIFHSINQLNKSLEIGATWLHPRYWGKGVNNEMKFLMLQFCFETLGTIRVQLKANHNNMRSRKAIEKIGATYEGILRKDKILENGTIRNGAYYSIIDDDWPEVKFRLLLLMEARSHL
jgi:RimJ/RimL family protein N-acetyltransferase